MSVDKYLSAKYVAGKYTCHNFANDVWREETGNALNDQIIEFLDKQKTFPGMRKGFVRIKHPISPCIVLFKPNAGHRHHVGIFLRGRVLHLAQLGVKFQTLDAAKIGFKELRFYKCQ